MKHQVDDDGDDKKNINNLMGIMFDIIIHPRNVF